MELLQIYTLISILITLIFVRLFVISHKVIIKKQKEGFDNCDNKCPY